MCGQGAHDCATGGPNIPEEDSLIVGTGDEHIALGTEGQAVDVVVVAQEGDGMWLSGDDIPEADGFVIGAGGEGAPVRGPGDDVDTGEVAGERLDQRERGCGRVDVDGGVCGGGGKVFARGRES